MSLLNVVEFPSDAFKIVNGRDCDCASASAEETSAAEGQKPESPPEDEFWLFNEARTACIFIHVVHITSVRDQQ
jgi:hypothetical protein